MSSCTNTQPTSKAVARLSLGASLLALTLGLGAGAKAHAQTAVTTAITPTTGAGATGTTVAGQDGQSATGATTPTTPTTVTACAIQGTDPGCTVSGGTLRGGNLFHSFNEFDLANDHGVLFTTADSVLRTIVRVTGSTGANSDGSDIQGLMKVQSKTAGGDTDLYFINPKGVTFGAGARVDVPGAFYVSTADKLLTADGSLVFAASAAGGNLNTFTAATPASFSFDAANVGKITIGLKDNPFALSGLTRAARFAARDIALTEASFEAGMSSFLVNDIANDATAALIDAGDERITIVGKELGSGTLSYVFAANVSGTLFATHGAFKISSPVDVGFSRFDLPNVKDTATLTGTSSGRLIVDGPGSIIEGGIFDERLFPNVTLINHNGIRFGRSSFVNTQGAIFLSTSKYDSFSGSLTFDRLDESADPETGAIIIEGAEFGTPTDTDSDPSTPEEIIHNGFTAIGRTISMTDVRLTSGDGDVLLVAVGRATTATPEKPLTADTSIVSVDLLLDPNGPKLTGDGTTAAPPLGEPWARFALAGDASAKITLANVDVETRDGGDVVLLSAGTIDLPVLAADVAPPAEPYSTSGDAAPKLSTNDEVANNSRGVLDRFISYYRANKTAPPPAPTPLDAEPTASERQAFEFARLRLQAYYYASARESTIRAVARNGVFDDALTPISGADGTAGSIVIFASGGARATSANPLAADLTIAGLGRVQGIDTIPQFVSESAGTKFFPGSGESAKDELKENRRNGRIAIYAKGDARLNGASFGTTVASQQLGGLAERIDTLGLTGGLIEIRADGDLWLNSVVIDVETQGGRNNASGEDAGEARVFAGGALTIDRSFLRGVAENAGAAGSMTLRGQTGLTVRRSRVISTADADDNTGAGISRLAGRVTLASAGDILIEDSEVSVRSSSTNGFARFLKQEATKSGASDEAKEAYENFAPRVQIASTGGSVTIKATGAPVSNQPDGAPAFAGGPAVRPGLVSAQTTDIQDAGSVTITAPRGVRIEGGAVTTSSSGNQARVFSRFVPDPSDPSTNIREDISFDTAGAAGALTISSDGSVSVSRGVVTSSTTGSGNAGLVRLDAGGRLILESGADVTTSTTSTGQAGAIRLRGGAGVTIAAGEVDDATGLAQDKAGVVCTGEAATGDCAEVSSAATGAGTGAPGTVEILAGGDAVRLNQARLSTAAGASVPAGAGSSITIANTGASGADRVLIANSRVSAQTEGARDAGAVTIATPGGVTLANATITSSTTGGGKAGTVQIGSAGARVGRFTMDGGEVETSTTQAGAAGEVSVFAAGPLRVQGGARIGSETGGAGAAGQVTLDANGRLIVAGGARVGTNATLGSTGRAGAISLRGGAGVTVAAGAVDDAGQATGVTNLTCGAEGTDARCAQVSSQSAGTGGAGSVTITADAGGVQATQALVSTQAGAAVLATASPGAVTIRADGAGPIALDRATITARSLGAANAGAVALQTSGAVTLTNATVTSTTAGTGAGGAVTIGDLTQRVASLASTGSTISSTSSGANAAGAVRIASAGRVAITGGSVESAATGTGSAGQVEIDTTTGGLSVSGAARVSTEAGAGARDGAGSNVRLTAGTGAIDINGATVTAETKGGAKAGDVALQTTGAVTLTNATVTSTTSGAGAGGAVTIGTASQRVASLTTTSSRVASSSLAAASGNAGAVQIASAGRVAVSGGTVESEALGTGAAGGVTIRSSSGDIVLAGKARVSTEAGRGARDGAGSDLTLDAGSGAIEISDATVTAETKGAAKAGLVTLIAGKLTRLLGGARVSSETDGQGAAGGVAIQAAGLEMRGGSVVTSSTDANNGGAEGSGARTGQAGDVTIVTRGPDQASANPPAQIFLSDASTKISSESGANGGAAGRIGINATGAVRVVNGAQITTETRSGGSSGAAAFPLAATDLAGTVRIKSGVGLWLAEGGTVTTSTTGAAKAGDIIIDGPLLSVIGSSLIQASTAGRANAGNVRIGEDQSARPGSVLIADGGQINTNVTGGSGGVAAGSITLTLAPGGVLELKDTTAPGGPGTITTSAAKGAATSGGSIAIAGAKYILSDGGVIQATGDVPNARATIAAQAFVSSADRRNVVLVDGVTTISGEVDDPARGTEIPDVGFLDASAVLNDQCLAVRADGVASVLATQPLGPRPRPAGAPTAPASCAAKTDQ